MRFRLLSAYLVCQLCLICSGTSLYASEPVVAAELADRLQSRIQQIVGFGSRVPGYAGHEKTAEVIIDHFKQLGVERLIVDEFPLAMPIDKGARLLSDDLSEPILLHPLWPNLVRCVTTGPEGLTGPIYYVGKGDYEDYNGLDLAGAIVVMDFNSGQNYLKARDLGAEAILFLEPQQTNNYEARQKVLQIPLNVPRLWVPANERQRILDLVKAQSTVTIHSRMQWQTVTCRNIYAEIPGTDPNLNDERVLLTANYDSISVVPSLAPGAEQAGGLAVLMELAEHFKKHPPRRPVAFLATTARAQQNQGIMRFLISHCAGEDYGDHYAFHTDGTNPKSVPRHENLKLRVMFGLDMVSHSRAIGSFYATELLDDRASSGDLRRQMLSGFGKRLGEYADELSRRNGWPGFYRNGISPIGGKGQRSHLPVALAFDGDVGSQLGHRFITLASCDSTRDLLDTPLDLPRHMDFDALGIQGRNTIAMLDQAVNDPAFIRKSQTKTKLSAKTIHHIYGMSVKAVQAKLGEHAIASTPVPGALIVQITAVEPRPGTRPNLVAITNASGRCVFPTSVGKRYGYKLDPEDGRIIYAADRGQDGHGTYPLDVNARNSIMVLFRCESLEVYNTIDPIRLKGLNNVSLLDKQNSQLVKYGYADLPEKSLDIEGVIAFVPPGESAKMAMGRGFWGFQQLLLKADDDNPMGIGYSPAQKGTIFLGTLRSVRDMAHLNRSRMELLKKFGIVDDLSGRLLEQADNAQEEAERALVEQDYWTYTASIREAFGLQSAAYPLLKNVARDTVKGLVFYFALLIPFAFFMERLLFAFPDIMRRILGVLGVLVIMFVAIRFVHPAFEISTSPYVIFMAFVLLAMSTLVLVIIIVKFNEQMAQLRQTADNVHHTDVGRISASFTAIMLGISSMRKRKLRTILTTTTLVLLTFTVLSFTSVRSFTSYFRIPVMDKAPYEGMLLRDRRWNDISQTFIDYATSAFAPANTARRCWLYLGFDENLALTVTGDKGQTCDVGGVVGMDANEPEVTGFGARLVAGRWLTGDASKDEVVVTTALAEQLGIIPQQMGHSVIEVFGKPFVVVGMIDAQVVEGFRDLDDQSICPLSPYIGAEAQSSAKVNEQQVEAEDRRAVVMRDYQHMDASQILFMDYERLLSLGGQRKSLAIRLQTSGDQQDKIEAFLERTTAVVFAQSDGASFAYSAIGATGVSGLSSLLVPILIAAFIVINTIMGSVHERQREIHVYSSVGLAPVHIAALFMAESAVYAVLGAMFGYALGQGVAKIVTVYDLFPGINLNYSSTSVILATLLVMATVFLAALYPSWLASRMAVPDVTRQWKIPKPEQGSDRWTFDFPFTVSSSQALSLLMFLNDFFSGHQEASVGKFFTRDVALRRVEDDLGQGFALSMQVWLAPFDLGVSQGLTLSVKPTEDENITRIELLILRQEGEHASWYRLNRGFLRELRKQFLIYRTIPEDKKQAYSQNAREVFGLQTAS